MAILVYIDSSNGKIAKNAQEAVSYAKQIDGDVTVVTFGGADDSALASLGNFGASKVLVAKDLSNADDRQITKLVVAAAEQCGADTVVCTHDLGGRTVAPRISVRMKAGLVSGAVDLPSDKGVKVNVFSGKAAGYVQVNTSKRVISLMPNSLPANETGGKADVEAFSGDFGSSTVVVKETKKLEGDIPLTEAELVVSAGRGLKGPENWGMVEDLAKALGAATACSRPVADIGWRPHHEHVGQTGIAIRPNLYIAAGISGAIQHLAGVNSSKVIVVINTDPEAPFFKAADYGIIGDAFEVLPKITAAVNALKEN